MTTQIQIDVPIYRLDRYETFERQGKITLSSSTLTLEEGSLTKDYDRLRTEVSNLSFEINNRSRLAATISELEDEIRWKGTDLKNILADIEKATEHLNTLKLFLKNLGLDSNLTRVTFDKKLLLSQTASELEVQATEEYPGSEF